MLTTIPTFIFLTLTVLIPGFSAQAGNFSTGFNAVDFLQGESGVRQYGTLGEVVFGLIAFALTAMAAIALVVMLYGGFLYVTSMGEEDKTRKAKQIIFYALIGLAVIMASGALVNFVIISFLAASGG